MELSTIIDEFNSDVGVKNGSLAQISSAGNFVIHVEKMENMDKKPSIFDGFNFSPFLPISEYIQKRENMRIRLIIQKDYYSKSFVVLLVIETKEGETKGEFYLTKKLEWKPKTGDMLCVKDPVKIPIDFDLEDLLKALDRK